MYDSNQFVFQQTKQVNDEEQLLRIFHSLDFEIKCNNHKKDLFDFFYQEPFLSLKVCIIILVNSANTNCRPFQVKINCSKFVID